MPAGLTLTTQANGTGLISGTPTPESAGREDLPGPRHRQLRADRDAGPVHLCRRFGRRHAGGDAIARRTTPPLQSQVEALAQLLAGDDVSISNVTYTGVARAVGSFDGGLGATGLSSGIILSSGAVGNVNGTNT